MSSAWLTEEAALAALAERQKDIAAGRTDRPDRTLAELAEEYLRPALESAQSGRMTGVGTPASS